MMGRSIWGLLSEAAAAESLSFMVQEELASACSDDGGLQLSGSGSSSRCS
jgi:hypothetical protein